MSQVLHFKLSLFIQECIWVPLKGASNGEPVFHSERENTLCCLLLQKVQMRSDPFPIQLDPYRDQARTWFLTNTVHQPQDWVFWKAPIRGAVLRSWIRNFPLFQQRLSWGINGYHTTGQTPLMEEHPFYTSGFFFFFKGYISELSGPKLPAHIRGFCM